MLNYIFRGGLSDPLSSIMPLHDPNWMLEKYIDIALQLSGSPFTRGIVEKENNAPVITSTPEPCHKMAAASEFRPIMTAVRTGQKTALYAAVHWLTASRIVLSTHGF